MQRLILELENCYGIQKMHMTVDYSHNNVAIIYAPNGTMKSSLAKTFEAIRDGRPVEERIYGRTSSSKITDDENMPISDKQIIVINPFQENPYEEQGLLMANDALRKEYQSIHKSLKEKTDDLYGKIKEKLGYSGRKKFDVKSAMLRDWDMSLKEEYDCLSNIKASLNSLEMVCPLSSEDLNYDLLFSDKICSMMKGEKTTDLIEKYETKYKELVSKSLYMQQGVIDHNNYGSISSSLNDNGFFAANNEVVLNAKDGSASLIVKNKQEFENLIKKEKEQVLNTKEVKDLFDKINKLFIKNKETREFNVFLQEHQEIIVEYKDIDLFKKKVWVKAFLSCEKLLDEILDKHKEAQVDLNKLRDAARKETTDWKKALSLFKERFYVPFTIEPSNQEDVILNMELPSFKYIFSDEREKKEVTKDDLLSVLSTGERRAYYILSMIFQVLVAKKHGEECLLVLDDISESFDYKNKYAIIEYISDISEYKNENGETLFKILLLTHNFDFYRTIASRITQRQNCFIAFLESGQVKCEGGQYTRNIFIHYKRTLEFSYEDSIMLSSIPFVRNLIEYTEGQHHEDYLTLTSILHYKEDTRSITLSQIQEIFKRHWLKSSNINFAENRENELVYDILMRECEKIEDVERLEIKNKLILSMAIRLKSELYMRNKILSNTPDGQNILDNIVSNQTAELIKISKSYVDDFMINILETVAMITPENIHLNSFMFEPILDMSLRQLYDLHSKIENLTS